MKAPHLGFFHSTGAADKGLHWADNALLRLWVRHRILKENWRRMCPGLEPPLVLPDYSRWVWCGHGALLFFFLRLTQVLAILFQTFFSLNKSDLMIHNITQHWQHFQWEDPSTWALPIRCADPILLFLAYFPVGPCWSPPAMLWPGAQGPSTHFCVPRSSRNGIKQRGCSINMSLMKTQGIYGLGTASSQLC